MAGSEESYDVITNIQIELRVTFITRNISHMSYFILTLVRQKVSWEILNVTLKLCALLFLLLFCCCYANFVSFVVLRQVLILDYLTLK